MPGKRISELTALSGAGSANNDDVLIFDVDAGVTKRISRSQLAEGMVEDLPLQYYLGVLNSAPTQRLNGDALALGDYYLDAVTKYTTVYNGSGWNSYASVIAAQAASEAARDAAIAARNAAQLAETNAETAETNAETAEAGAVAARLGSEAARDMALAHRKVVAELVELSWSPRDFLKDGGAGVYLMPLDPVAGNLWTDTARTTPATAVGQRIASARLVTETGSFLYAEQATLADRPYLGRYPAGGIRNRINNSAAAGAVVGAPGTLPTTWGVSGGTIVRETVATGVTAEGEEYIDIRLTGSPGASGIVQLGGNQDTIALAGEMLCWSVKVARIAGSATNIDYARLQMVWRDSAGSFISGSFDETGNIVDFKNETALAVRQMVATAPALSAFVLPQIRLNCTGAIDITLRISAGQVEAGDSRSSWQRTASVSGLAVNTFVDVIEAGKPTIWCLYRSDASDSLPVTLAGYGSNATVVRAEQAAQSVTEGVTVGAGAYQVLGAVGSRTVSLTIVSRALTDGETELADTWLTLQRGESAAFTGGLVPNGPIRLDDLGYAPSEGDVRDMIAAAFALGSSREVIVPYNVAPWISYGTLTLAADQKIIFEAGAVLDQRHAAAPGILMSGDRSALIGAKITSTLYPYQTLAAVSGTAAATNSHRRRGINVTGADCVIEDLDIEYAAQGITAYGARLRASIKRAQYLRSSEGWAAAVNMRPGSDYSVIDVGRIMDCDRALEPEDGASHIRFIGKPGVLERIESRWFDCTTTQAETFTISAHSHSGPENYLPTEDVTFENFTVVDCASVVNFTRANGSDAQMPKDCHVRNLRVLGQLVSGLPTPPIAILIDGNGCSVEMTAEGAINANKRVLINRGTGNKVTIKGDPVLQVPWVNVSANATDSEVVLDVGALTTQPTASSDSHLVEVNGLRTKVTARLSGVQNVGYIRLNAGGVGSKVEGCNIVAPASLAASAMVRMATDDCHITNNTFRDDAGLMHAVRMITGCDRNFVANNIIRRAAGAAVQIDSGATGNIVVNNSLDGATITNSGSGSVVTPNY